MKIKDLVEPDTFDLMMEMMKPCEGKPPGRVLAAMALAAVFCLKLFPPDERERAKWAFLETVKDGMENLPAPAPDETPLHPLS